MAKRLELIKEAAPSIRRAGVFLFRGSEANAGIVKTMGNTADALKIELQLIELDGSTDLQGVFLAVANQQVDAIVVGDHGLFLANAAAISAAAAKQRLPSSGPLELAASGGLVSYGVNFPDQFRRAAVFVDKILKGAKPSDLPVEQATKFTMVVNNKAAKALEIEMPTSILLRADEVIE